MAQPVAFRRLPKDLRDQTRREEIVGAARRCVVRHGFHGASMAEIAAAARMSVGQIYRYFPSKEAIVHAIVEQIAAQRLQQVTTGGFGRSVPAMLAQLSVSNLDDQMREDHALILEITAEATRNAEVAKILRETEQRLHKEVITIFRREIPGVTESEASARVELLATIAEGTMLRRVVGRRAQQADLIRLYREVLSYLMLVET